VIKMKKLLFSITKKDFDITYFSGKGAGGQHRNKHQNYCRIKHRDSGVLVTGQEERSQKTNLKNAFKRLVNHPDFKSWLKIKSSRVAYGEYKLKKELDEIVENDMKSENLKVEYLEV